jgi:rhodanese-related sulfurtransferase
MPKTGRYVLYCEFGLKSAHLAELMRREGFDAAHFRSGLSGLIEYVRERGLPTPEALGGALSPTS